MHPSDEFGYWQDYFNPNEEEEEKMEQREEEWRSAYLTQRAEEYASRTDILVCYESGVIETDTYEWECMEGKYAQDQQPYGQVIDLWDLKGPINR